jgi:hypothetical protein
MGFIKLYAPDELSVVASRAGTYNQSCDPKTSASLWIIIHLHNADFRYRFRFLLLQFFKKSVAFADGVVDNPTAANFLRRVDHACE